MPLRVLSPGLFSLPVGLARPGRRALGVPPGGAADVASFLLGNALVGNAPDTPAVELTLLGPTLRAETDTGCVVFGAPFDLTRDGEPIAANHTFTLRAGEVLRIGGTPTGCRAYLCAAGGIPLPPVPTPLASGELLACAESRVRGRSIDWRGPHPPSPSPSWRGGVQHRYPAGPSARVQELPRIEHPLSMMERGTGGEVQLNFLRVLPGPQRDWFPDDSFFTRTWTVGEASNRMGVRLVGEPIPKRAGELVSEPVAAGAVQVTHDGRPIVLGVDGQTIGGYPKVAHVVRTDLDRVGQLRPGDAVRFVEITADEAETLVRVKWEELNCWVWRLSAGEPVNFIKN